MFDVNEVAGYSEVALFVVITPRIVQFSSVQFIITVLHSVQLPLLI